jgi:xylulose-5-phosphate/fructose-6-phosphate phosphoketolase
MTAPIPATPLAPDQLRKMHAYWRAANYLSVGQIYLYDNPLLKEPLTLEHVKPRLLGHWGTTPGLNFIYVHFNRLIKEHDLNVIYVTGPGHGGPGAWELILPASLNVVKSVEQNQMDEKVF